jgi:hypothetical protein
MWEVAVAESKWNTPNGVHDILLYDIWFPCKVMYVRSDSLDRRRRKVFASNEPGLRISEGGRDGNLTDGTNADC